MRAIDDQMHERLFDIVTVPSINYSATGIIFKDERQNLSIGEAAYQSPVQGRINQVNPNINKKNHNFLFYKFALYKSTTFDL